MNRIHLFCFPYAGGSAMMYCRWRSLLSAFIQIHPIELSGRGKRMNEPFYQTMEQAVEDAYLSIPVHVLDEPIAFFGYSMGSLIAYELARYLHEKHGKEPIHLFAAARRAPQIQGDGLKLYRLPEAEFLQEIIKLGGMSAEVLENKELLEMILPRSGHERLNRGPFGFLMEIERADIYFCIRLEGVNESQSRCYG